MITPYRDNRGLTAAEVRCDTCGHVTRLRVDAERRRGEKGPLVINDGQAHRKLTAQGWDVRGGEHTCPSCIINKRTTTKPKEEEMAISQQDGLRQPTRDQKREIMAMLQDVYDPAAQRYRGAETDKTIAETLGDGILFGWVAQLREEFFGPDGNEAADLLISEVQEWMKKADALSAKLHDSHAAWTKDMREFNEAKAKVAGLVDRLSKAARPPMAVAK